jgi:hypothetical protein
MNVSRRTLITGGIIGAITAGIIGFFEGMFETYKSDIWIKSRQETSTTVDLILSNLDENRTVLDKSFSLAPDEDFRREGVFSNETRYHVTVQTDDHSAEKEFETCCQGFQVSVYVEQDEIQILLGHYD